MTLKSSQSWNQLFYENKKESKFPQVFLQKLDNSYMKYLCFMLSDETVVIETYSKWHKNASTGNGYAGHYTKPLMLTKVLFKELFCKTKGKILEKSKNSIH